MLDRNYDIIISINHCFTLAAIYNLTSPSDSPLHLNPKS